MNETRLKYPAILFDLYGTLVGEFASADWEGLLGETAGVLGVGSAEFRKQWSATAIERQTGRMGTVEENLRVICQRLGMNPSQQQIAIAIEMRMKMYRSYFRPRRGAEDVLREAKAIGYPVGLVSMCAPDTPAMWRACPLAKFVDAEVFSCETGLRKPDTKIYLAATGRLGVEPRGCLYVGDGAYGELAGAAALGMRAILVRDPGETPGEMLRPEEENWAGESVNSLEELLPLL